MEELLQELLTALQLPAVEDWHWAASVAAMVFSIIGLGKGADWLVDLAVSLSLRWGMPRVVVGATIVSLGTTTPEAVVSVMAAFAGSPQIALGNAVGSIICDTGLILGIGCLIAPLPIDPRVANRQGWMQFGSGFLLVALCVPWADPMSALSTGGVLPQWAGWFLTALLVAYLGWSIKAAQQMPAEEGSAESQDENSPLRLALAMLVAFALVVASSAFLIATAKELAERMQIPPAVIAATLVAFGTSLPELTIVVTATLKGQGALAIGNVIGADILNVLFVAGVAAAVTPQGLHAVPNFFAMQFPAMLFVLLVFRLGIWKAKDGELNRPFGVVLLLTYVAVTALSFVFSSGGPVGH